MSGVARRMLLVAVSAGALAAQALKPGANKVMLRGQAQDVYRLPAQGTSRGVIIFLPGDGGWRGFAVDMAQQMAAFGWEVDGWDTKRYLESFTTDKATLTERVVMADFRSMARVALGERNDRVVLAGWSEGAALALLGAASPENRDLVRGLLAIGLPDAGVLGWRMADSLTYITKGEPNEPHFSTAPHIAKVAPLGMVMIHSSGDEWISKEAAKKMFDLAGSPKRFFLIEARNHRYDGNRDEFFRAIQEALEWLRPLAK